MLISGFAFGQNPATAISFDGNSFNPNVSMWSGSSKNSLGTSPDGRIFFDRDRPVPFVFVYNGSQYVDDAYAQGSTTLHGKKDFAAPMRYNAQQNVIEFLDEDQTQRELLRRPYITANFGGKTYMIVEYLEENQEKLGYFNRLNEGETRLYFMPKKILKQDLGYRDDNPIYKYQDISEYYLKKGKAPAEKNKLNKRNISSMLKDKTAELEAFISENDLNLHSEEEVIQLLDYYNSIDKPEAYKKDAQS
ncbi:MAG: hypothetical protein E4H26_02830 [Flavobacteriales bacterium]|nr:MAG: hypothetical protein E4H26_02830 [Flavobacteriales bacterium]